MPTPTTPATAPGATARRPSPGGRRRRQPSRYGVQMREKQGLKGIYGIREEQLSRYFHEAHRSTAETGPYLVELLERRLDNALFRAGFAETRPAARQLASHRLVTVNGHAVTIPSLRLKKGDVVEIKTSKRTKPLFTNFVKHLQNVPPVTWLQITPENFAFKVTALPAADEAGLGVDIRAIVEYFAR